jgi:hypothetical protein
MIRLRMFLRWLYWCWRFKKLCNWNVCYISRDRITPEEAKKHRILMEKDGTLDRIKSWQEENRELHE